MVLMRASESLFFRVVRHAAISCALGLPTERGGREGEMEG